MPAVDPNRVRDLFLAAVEMPVAGRPAYLAKTCGTDADLREAVDRLLAAHADPVSMAVPATAEYFECDGSRAPTATGAFAAQPDDGTVLIGKYKLVEPIGEHQARGVFVGLRADGGKQRSAVGHGGSQRAGNFPC